MSAEHDKARKAVAKQVRIWPHWTESGEIGLIVNLTGPNGEPGNTVGSCLLKDAKEELRSIMRGLECGYIIAHREINHD